MAIVIPDWIARAPKPTDSTGQSSNANEHANGSTPNDLQIATNGREQIIPVLYGGPERMAGLIYCVATPKVGALAGSLVFACILCEGPVESVSDFQMSNGDPLPVGITVTAYTGAPGQGVDPWLASAIPGFAETLPGIAYFVVRCTTSQTGFPAITALVKGLKVSNPSRLFKQVQSDIYTGWTNSTPAPLYVPNAGLDRAGDVNAHALLNPTPAALRRRLWTWAVPNDALTRTVSVSLNKDALALYPAGIGLELLGGGTPRAHIVQVDLITGALSTFSGGGGVASVVAHPNHWEVVFAMANNATGNISMVLSLYPNT